MRQVRKGVFETNSSSVHAICIATESQHQEKPKCLYTTFGEYGWGDDRLYFAQEKLSYALTALFTAFYGDYDYVRDKVKAIKMWLIEDGIDVCDYSDTSTSEAVYGKDIWLDSEYWHINGSLDHGIEAKDFVEYVFASKENMWDWLFTDDSYVITGNDNVYSDEEYPKINVDYPHKEFVKGN